MFFVSGAIEMKDASAKAETSPYFTGEIVEMSKALLLTSFKKDLFCLFKISIISILSSSFS